MSIDDERHYYWGEEKQPNTSIYIPNASSDTIGTI